MKIFQHTLVVLSMFMSGYALADDGFTVLHRQGSWTVFKFIGEKAGDPPSYCSAKSGDASAFFELVGMEGISCMSAEATQWKFRKRKAAAGFMIGISGIFVGSGQYFSNGLQICGPNEEIDLLLDLFWEADGRTIDAYDHRKRKIGSFPGSGRETARRKWRACRDKL